MPRLPSLRKNVGALIAIQIASYVPPLLTLPWLTRVLGPAGFGRLSFCVAVTGYFVLFADYGFNLSATRQIAVHWDDRAGRSRVFWNTILVKTLLATVGFPVLLLLTLVIARFGENRNLLLINYLLVLGSVLTPTWYFTGTERQAVASGILIAVRFIAVPATFLFVRSGQDLQIAAFIPSLLSVMGGLLCLMMIARNDELDRVRISRRELIAALKDGWHLFVSTASISLYQGTNTVLLGLVAGDAAVGHYAAAEKVVQAAQGLLTPIGQSAYPRISRLMRDSRDEAFALIRKVLKIQGTVTLLASILLFVTAPSLVRLLYGAAYEDTVGVLRWLAALPFLIGLNNVFGVQTMLAMGMNQLVSRILIVSGGINVSTLFVLARWFGAAGAAMAVAGTELLIGVVEAVIIYRRNLPIFRAEGDAAREPLHAAPEPLPVEADKGPARLPE
jgi:polysaccharide transporter, PST family